MARKQSPEKARYWQKIFQRQASSGLSVRRFCSGEGISQPSFYAWRKRLRERSDDDVRSPGRLPCGEEASNSPQLFVPLKLVDAAATLEIVHPLGCRIQVSGDINPLALRHVLEALAERGAR